VKAARPVRRAGRRNPPIERRQGAPVRPYTYFRIVNWGWYYLSTVLDDFSRYIVAWRLSATMGATDVTETLDQALAFTGVDQVRIKHRPRLLSDNGSAYLSDELKEYLGERRMTHTRGAPYHPQTQGKIERWHRSMKNVVKMQHYYFPWELEAALRDFVAYYNNERYHESLDNVTPADVYYGRHHEVISERKKIKRLAMQRASSWRTPSLVRSAFTTDTTPRLV
jgi:putative transposase